jgi:hypothetical protein
MGELKAVDCARHLNVSKNGPNVYSLFEHQNCLDCIRGFDDIEPGVFNDCYGVTPE